MKKLTKLVCSVAFMALAASMFTSCGKKNQRVKVRWFVGLGAGSDEPPLHHRKRL